MAPTTTTLFSSQNPASINQNVWYSIRITNLPASANGIVRIYDGGTAVYSQSVYGRIYGGVGIIKYYFKSYPTAGTHDMWAEYEGDSTSAGSSSSTITEIINTKAVSTTTLSVAPNPAPAGAAVALTALVTGSAPTGSVTFKDGATTLGSATLSSGVAGLISSFSAGVHNLTASYGGNTTNNPSTAGDFDVNGEHNVVALQVGPSSMPNPGAMTSLYLYDAKGNVTSATDPNGNKSVFQYDALDRLKLVAKPQPADGTAAQTVVTIGHDGQDVILVTDARQLHTTYAVSGIGGTQALNSPDSGSQSATFDAAGNVLTRTDARGKLTSFAYDPLGRLTNISFATGTATVFEYDGGGNPTPSGVGELTKITDESGSTVYAYDGLGGVVTKTQQVGTKTFTVGYGWGTTGSGKGLLTAIVYPSGSRINFAYDGAGRISSITVNPVNANGVGFNIGTTLNLLSGAIYNGSGNVKAWTWSDGTLYQRGYDAYGRLSSYPLGQPTGSGIAAGLTRILGYDNKGRITGYTHSNAGGAQSSFDQMFTYDNQDRLVDSTLSGTYYAYGYDVGDNRIDQLVGGVDHRTVVASTSNRLTSVQDAGSVTRTYSYDAAGHLTSDGVGTYSYSDRGRMKSATVGANTVNYLYNGLEQRISKVGPTVPTGAAYFVYDEAGRLIGEYDANGIPVAETVYLGDIPIAALKLTGAASTSTLQVNRYNVYPDQVNASRLITRATDQAIVWRWHTGEAFGASAANENPSSLGTFKFNQRFQGQIYDAETDNFYNYLRDYDPQTGRYITSDPIGLRGGINTYLYVNGNPITYVDPFGLEWQYSQSSGSLWYFPPGGSAGQYVASGYSGTGPGRDNPAMENVPNVGPTPQGTYDIGPMRNSPNTGPNVMDLFPQPGTNTFGRTDFQIHGNNSRNDASQGCIVLGPSIRRQIDRSGDRVIRVVP